MSACLQSMKTNIEDSFGTNKKKKQNVPRRTGSKQHQTGNWTSKKRP